MYHTIKAGETLYRLSREYDVSVDELKQINGIDDVSDIRVGTRLLIKKDHRDIVASETYTVEKGDTLYRIARNNGMNLNELMSLNGIDEDHVLKVGQVLKIAAPEGSSPESGIEKSTGAC